MVLAAAGSSDPAANATIADLAAALAARAGLARGRARVRVGGRALAGPGRRGAAPTPAAGGPVVVATYLLAPGYFADKIRDAPRRGGRVRRLRRARRRARGRRRGPRPVPATAAERRLQLAAGQRDGAELLRSFVGRTPATVVALWLLAG